MTRFHTILLPRSCRSWLAAAAVALVSMTMLPGAPQHAQALLRTVESQPEEFDRELALATFDKVWTLVRDTHFDPNYNGVDWDAAGEELRPKAAEAESMGELRGVIQELLGRLGQSHFALIPKEAAETLASDGGEDDEKGAASRKPETKADPGPAREAKPSSIKRTGPGQLKKPGDEAKPKGNATDRPDAVTRKVEKADVPSDADRADDQPADAENGEGYLGMDIRVIDDEVVVIRVESGGPADEAGVKTGWVIEEIRSEPVADIVERMTEAIGDDNAGLYVWQVIENMLSGPAGTQMSLAFRDGNDELQEMRITPAPSPGEVVKFGNLPPFIVTFDAERVALESDEPASIGLFRYNFWMPNITAQFSNAFADMEGVDGYIVDLRGNLGGVGGMVMGISGHFLDEPKSLGTFRTRDLDLQFVANPRYVSTSGKPIRPFDGPVALLVDGISASTSEVFAAGMQELGRVRVFGETTAGAALPAQMTGLPNGDALLHAFADFIPPSGVSVEGRGVTPDEPIALTREHLLAGRDPQMAAAMTWLETAVAEYRQEQKN